MMEVQDLEAQPGESLDILAGDWRIFQLSRGHRFSTDDMLCAWAGAEACPDASSLLDLGAGIGSVGLLALWRMSATARLVMVEAQEESHFLARRTLRLNGLDSRVEARFGDLRDPAMVPEQATFDLITCSPPYIPPGRGSVSPVPQRAAARIEIRGSVYDYLITAKRALAPGGRVSIVFAGTDPRGEDAIRAAGLALTWRRDVCFRGGRTPTVTLLVAAHPEDAGLLPQRPESLQVRDEDGQWTEEMLSIRRRMGALLNWEIPRGA